MSITPKAFVDDLASLRFENAFNPYVDRCPVHDVADAPRVRRIALTRMLQAAVRVEVESIWIGRDLGYRGGRRTGLALTDEVHVQAHADRWGISVERATKGQALGERTAAVIWSVLAGITVPVFLWNVFPLHPFESGDPFTNRAHNSAERRAGEQLLEQLFELLAPRQLVAIGNDAAGVARHFGDRCDVIQVRHPSYGGQSEFVRQVEALYPRRSSLRQRPLI